MDEKAPRRRKKSLKRIIRHKILRMRNIFNVIALIITIILIISLLSLKIIPKSFIMSVLAISIIINLISVLCINVHKKAPLKIIGGVILGVMVFISVLGLFFARTTSSFINESFKQDNHVYHQNTYYLLGFNNSTVNNINLDGTYGIYENMYNISGAVEKLNKKYNLSQVGFKDIYEMFYSMNIGQINYILLEKTAYEAFFSLPSPISENNYKILYEYDVYSKNNKTYSENKEKFNILVRTINEQGLSNNNFILTIDMNSKKLVVTSLPQNAYMLVNNGTRAEKLKFIDVYGIDEIIDSVENLFETNIDYRINISEKELQTFIDYLNGIKFCNENDIILGETEKLDNGCHTIDGTETIKIMSYESYTEKNKIFGNLLENLFEKTLENISLNNYDDTLSYISKIYETNMSEDLGIEILKSILNNEKWDIEELTLEGTEIETQVLTTYTTDVVQLSDTNDVNVIKDKIKETLN